MKLYDICISIAKIENGLACGQINYSYDNLMSAMKPGHPADILDEIFSEVGNAVCFGQEVTSDKIKELLMNLQDFKEYFKIKELEKPIKNLTTYLEIFKESAEN
jgi:hypothetical protein